MRFKFRAWDEQNQEMLDWNTGHWFYEEDNGFHCGYTATDGTPGIGAGDWVDCHVMQFTGLYDKNGTEIYEGDILQLDDILCEITFDDGGFQMITSHVLGNSPARQEKTKRFEVIGNIYESHYLLQDENSEAQHD